MPVALNQLSLHIASNVKFLRIITSSVDYLVVIYWNNTILHQRHDSVINRASSEYIHMCMPIAPPYTHAYIYIIYVRTEQQTSFGSHIYTSHMGAQFDFPTNNNNIQRMMQSSSIFFRRIFWFCPKKNKSYIRRFVDVPPLSSRATTSINTNINWLCRKPVFGNASTAVSTWLNGIEMNYVIKNAQ